MNFYRGLIIVNPYGTYIKNHSKTIVVKSKKINTIIHKKLLLIQDKIGLGIIQLDEPKKINLQQFSKLRRYHKISEEDRIKWWNGYHYLYSYSIIDINIFRIPILLEYPTGPQITVLPEHIIYKKIFIGMSGYYYPEMYPVKKSAMLEYYSQNLNSVEINSTFYKFMSKSSVEKLSKYNLTYSVKVYGYITHNKKMKNIGKIWGDFYHSLEGLHDKIRCFLFQLSPNFHYNEENYSRLEKIQKILHSEISHYYAFEFRHISWFNNTNVQYLFQKNNWIFVISNVHGNWLNDFSNGFNPSLRSYYSTLDAIYLRLHGTKGKYVGTYDSSDFRKIFKFVELQKAICVFIYFNNTDDGSALDDSIILAKKYFSKYNQKIIPNGYLDNDIYCSSS